MPVVGPDGRVWCNPLAEAHGGDIEAMRREIEDTHIESLMERYRVTRGSVLSWERKTGAIAIRTCVWCQQDTRGADMRVNTQGGVARRCKACDVHPTKGLEWTLAYERQYKTHKANNPARARRRALSNSSVDAERVSAEYRSVRVAARAAIMPLPHQGAGYFNPYARA